MTGENIPYKGYIDGSAWDPNSNPGSKPAESRPAPVSVESAISRGGMPVLEIRGIKIDPDNPGCLGWLLGYNRKK